MFNATKYEIQLDIHHNKSIIGFKFGIDAGLLSHLKTHFKNVSWSRTKKCWYVNATPENKEIAGLSNIVSSKSALMFVHPTNQLELNNFVAQLKLKSYSVNTQRTYTVEFSQLLYALKAHPVKDISAEKVKSYLLYCIDTLKIKEFQLSTRINAIKFYFEQVLKQPDFMIDIPRPKKPSTLPKVINDKDIKKLFEVTTNLKHRLILKLCYGMGLRVSEIVKLKITHIDSGRMQVHIASAKGKKDRYVNLPESVLNELRNYYIEYKPKEFLFEGQYGGAYSIRSAQAVFKDAMRKARIRKAVGIHSLRHSYATHLLEHGTDISFIQKLLGHKDVSTTLIYAKVGNKSLAKVISPLDRL
jgi:site-specific recombinase XerD